MTGASVMGTQSRATFRDLFASREFCVLWLAQVLSVVGDQLARVALTVLVYDRTQSALLAAVAFAASVLPQFIGGVTLSRLADRLPKRRVMLGADLSSGILVCAMALPRVPVAGLIALLFAVTMIGAVFLAARAAFYAEILQGERYALGTAVTMTTVMFAQVAGFAAGGIVVAFLGVRLSLLVDAATFGASALIVRTWVRARPVTSGTRPEVSGTAARAGGFGSGLRLVLGSRAMRTPVLFGWLCAFYCLPEGVATPLAKAVGGGAITVGLILAAQALGSSLGVLGFSRLVSPAQRLKWMGPLAIAACCSLVPFAADPGLPGTLLLLAVSGVFGCYQVAANAAFVQAAPPDHRSQAFGIAQGGLCLGQGVAIVLAGAAAQHVSPASVIAVAGGIGALCALGLTRTRAGSARLP